MRPGLHPLVLITPITQGKRRQSSEQHGREREGRVRGGLVWGRRVSPLAGLREARHAPQRKSLSLIVWTKSETTAAPSISLRWHDVWWYSRVWLHMPSCVLCCVVWKWKKKGRGEVMKSPESLKAFPPVSWNSQRSWITIAAVFSPITFFLFFPLQPSTGYLIPNCLCCWSAGKINDKQLGIDNNQRLAASLWRHVLQSRLCQ